MAHFQQTYFGAASARRNAARVPPPTFFASQPPPSPRVVPVLEHREGFQADLDQVFEKGVKEGIRRVYLTLTALVTESDYATAPEGAGADVNSTVNQPRSLPPSPTSSSTVATVPEARFPAPVERSTSTSQTSSTRSPPRSEKFRVPVGYESAFRSPSVEAELRKLFAAAHQGNPVAMKLVQALARKAHETPRDHKSWGQKFLLVEWRNPMGPNPKYSNSTARATTGVANPRLNDPVEDWYLYYTTHSSSLPKGVRRDVQGNPYFPDLRASRLFAQMRPVQNTSPITLRTEYAVYSMELITTDGLYETIVQKHRLQIARATDCSPYNGPSRVDVEEVARHFARCGISVQLLNNDFVPWAREHQKGTMESL